MEDRATSGGVGLWENEDRRCDPWSSPENFDKRDATTFVIPRRGLLDAISSLEGKWVSPDPYAMSAHGDPKPEQLAKMPRHWSPLVTASEIEAAVSERLKPASVYKVRWIE